MDDDAGPPALPTQFGDVVPGRAYPIDAVAVLFGVTRLTARSWVRAGRLATLPRVMPRGPYRVLGSEILRLMGGRAPEAGETMAQRTRRAEAADADVRRLAKGRPQP